MIPISTLDDDFYIFDEKNYCLEGRHSHRVFQLGDVVKVEITRTNLEKKQLDLGLIQDKSAKAAIDFSDTGHKKKGRRR